MFDNLYENYSRKRLLLAPLPYEIEDEEEQYVLSAQTEQLPLGLIEDEL